MPESLLHLVQRVESARTALLQEVSDLRDDQGAFKPSPGEWSVAEILEHLLLAELGGITKIWSGLVELEAGRGWTGERPHQGKSIEAIIATTWQPKEIAPPVATPHLGGPLSAWSTALQSLTGVLEALGRRLDGQPLEAIVIPHFLSGPLDARQRLEFLRFHLERHREQVARVRTSEGFPG